MSKSVSKHMLKILRLFCYLVKLLCSTKKRCQDEVA